MKNKNTNSPAGERRSLSTDKGFVKGKTIEGHCSSQQEPRFQLAPSTNRKDMILRAIFSQVVLYADFSNMESSGNCNKLLMRKIKD
ncbi:hypothetical protein M0804_002046 [Polistes exclamans]|nr:hypothetical protein M0804_002046 [Polistes exclamans]